MEYTDSHVLQLQHGFDFFGDAFGRDPNIDAMRLAWQELGAEITTDWILEHPGSRPAAFWLFDAPSIGPRLQVVNRVSLQQQEKIRQHSGAECLRLHMLLCDGRLDPEPELDYLERHGLLTAAELAGCRHTS